MSIAQMCNALENLFRQRKPLVDEWVRGKHTDAEGVWPPVRYRDDYLLREMWRDCRNS
ncbi:hypothetical protein OG563_36770 [Nocardia vinacea]|uniref:Uncharacterized protein n=1 Tax=Nocardia vinacea TaxID=96468 RepID=A0ABZ1YN57_9NOCA|nr:hypothetical protein [Nocardia vinacea]